MASAGAQALSGVVDRTSRFRAVRDALTSRLPLRSIAAGRGGAPSVAAPVPPAAALEQVLTVADQVLATPSAAGPARAPTPGDVLVLSGGGMFGAAQAGMLAALCEQTQWCPEVIVGVSAGALNGTWLAHDFSAAHAAGLVEIWRGFTGRGVFPARAVSQVFNVIARRDAVQDGAALRALIDRCCPVARLEELPLPVHVAATDITTGRPHWFDTGPAPEVLYASAALPGLVPPITIDGATYVDGGVVANVPVARAVELGARRILCLDVSAGTGPGTNPSTALGVLLRSFSIALNSATDTLVDAASQAASVWRIRPVVPAEVKVNDWSCCSQLVDAGYDTMTRWLTTHGEELTASPRRRWRDLLSRRAANRHPARPATAPA